MKTIKIHQFLLNLAKRLAGQAYLEDLQAEEYPLGAELQPYVALANSRHQG